jgi:hypothetical protein
MFQSQLKPLLQIIPEMRRRYPRRPNPPRGSGNLQFRNRKRIDSFIGDCLVVAFDLTEVVTELVAEHGVCAEGVEVHVATHGHELGAREVVEG